MIIRRKLTAFWEEKAMNKSEFLRILEENLKDVPAEERESAVRYYSEYIDDAGETDDVFSELGNPAEIANKIKNDGRQQNETPPTATPPASGKNGLPVWAKVLITVLTFPFWIGPVAAAFGVSVGLVAAAVGMLLGGAASFGVGIYFMFFDFASGLFGSGSGLLGLGLGGLLGVGVFYLCKYEGIGVGKLCRLIFMNGGKK